MLRQNLKAKYFENAPLLGQFIKGRRSMFSHKSLMYKITTGFYMLYLWPVKKLFSKTHGFGLDFAKESKTYCAALQDLFHIYNHGEYNLIRVGAKHDGGYIMLDDFMPVNEVSNLRGGA